MNRSELRVLWPSATHTVEPDRRDFPVGYCIGVLNLMLTLYDKDSQVKNVQVRRAGAGHWAPFEIVCDYEFTNAEMHDRKDAAVKELLAKKWKNVDDLQRALAELFELNVSSTGSGVEGTPAAPVGTSWGPTDVINAAPEDKDQVFLNSWFQNGWEAGLPYNLPAVINWTKQQGYTLRRAEELIPALKGRLIAEAKALGLDK